MSLTTLPIEVSGYLLTFLGDPKKPSILNQNLSNLRLINKAHRDFIDNKVPVGSEKFNYKELNIAQYYNQPTVAQRIKLAGMKFQDRPVWQRVAIVCIFILTSPFYFAYKSPKYAMKSWVFLSPYAISAWNGFERAAKATVRIAGQILVKCATFAGRTFDRFIDHILIPSLEFTIAVEKFIHTHIMPPIKKIARIVARFLFITVPKTLYTYILSPLKNVVKDLAKLAFDHVLVHVLKTVKAIAKVLFITWPAKIYEHVLTPIGHALVKAGKYSYQHILLPAGRALINGAEKLYEHLLVPCAKIVRAIAKVLFVTWPAKIYTHVLAPTCRVLLQGAKKLCEHLLIPMMTIVRAIAKVLFITWPAKIYAHVLTPIGRAIARAGLFTYANVIKPVSQMIRLGARVTYREIIAPSIKAIATIARAVFVAFPKYMYETVIAPAKREFTNAKNAVYDFGVYVFSRFKIS